jgi:hypothetical protein
LSRFAPHHSAVTINWRIFGSAGFSCFKPELVIQRFTRCAAHDFHTNAHVKTIARVACISTVLVHCCELRSGIHVNDCAELVSLEGLVFNHAISMRRAQVNHYMTKSREEYAWKAKHGRGDVAKSDPEKFTKYTEDMFVWHDRNEESDLSALARLDGTIREMNRLREILRQYRVDDAAATARGTNAFPRHGRRKGI